MKDVDYGHLQPVASDNYEVGDEIAHGGMGVIRRARDRRTGRDVAIKQILDGRLQSQSQRGRAASLLRFEREARLTAGLQHPSIVPVYEIGLLEGMPFFAMKVVADTPLAALLSSKTTLAERLAVLPHVVDVADALAYAHSRGVIHRDLKPSNILVGEFGETVVIDWGLAKQLHASEDIALPEGLDAADGLVAPNTRSVADATLSVGLDEVPMHIVQADGGALTVAGQAMGTAAYMPPEQATGLPVDERADVYAIGAILYELLAGRPAYVPRAGSSDPVADVLERVRLQVRPPPLSSMNPAPPRDLIAIVDKAMAVEPSHRYPSARELAADLTQFQAGQLVGAHEYSMGDLLRRWIRKHRAPVAVAGVAIAALTVIAIIGIQRIRIERADAQEQQRLAEANHSAAEAQKRSAEASRADAEGLMSFMLEDLHGELRTIGRTDLLGKVASKADAYYAREQGSAGEGGSRAKALSNIGDVLLAQGDLTRATEQFRAALALRQQLADEDPDDTDRARALAAGHQSLGRVLQRQGELTNAATALDAAVAARRRAAASLPKDVDTALDLADALDALGTTRSLQGNLDEATKRFQEAQRLRGAAAAERGDYARVQADLARSSDNLAGVGWAMGESARARELYASVKVQRAKLVTDYPENADFASDLLDTHLRLAFLHKTGASPGPRATRLERSAAAKELASARSELNQALELARRMASRDQMNATWQAALATVHDGIGDIAMLAGGTKASAAAASSYEKAQAIRRVLTARNPDNTEFRYAAAVSRVKMARLHLAAKDAGKAVDELNRALAMIDALARANPDNSMWALASAQAVEQLGRTHLAATNLESAQEAYERAIRIREQLSKRDTSNASWSAGLAESYAALAAILERRGKHKSALQVQRKADELSTRLAKSHEGNSQLAYLARFNRWRMENCCGQQPTGVPLARHAGVLGAPDIAQGGVFASLTTGTDDEDIYGGLLGNEAGEMEGGFGFGASGFGPDQGGTGWSTIGSGKYGTIGQVSVPGKDGAKGARILIGNATTVGDLDKNIIRRYMRRKLPQIKYCYEKRLLLDADLKGTVVVSFVITPQGQVNSAHAAGVDDSVSTCVAAVIRGIQFPKPKGGGLVQVRYPFTFSTGD